MVKNLIHCNPLIGDSRRFCGGTDRHNRNAGIERGRDSGPESHTQG